jgi:hypothetical protein
MSNLLSGRMSALCLAATEVLRRQLAALGAHLAEPSVSGVSMCCFPAREFRLML